MNRPRDSGGLPPSPHAACSLPGHSARSVVTSPGGETRGVHGYRPHLLLWRKISAASSHARKHPVRRFVRFMAIASPILGTSICRSGHGCAAPVPNGKIPAPDSHLVCISPMAKLGWPWSLPPLGQRAHYPISLWLTVIPALRTFALVGFTASVSPAGETARAVTGSTLGRYFAAQNQARGPNCKTLRFGYQP